MIEITIGRSDAQPENYVPFARLLPGYQYFADQWVTGTKQIGICSLFEWPEEDAFPAAAEAFPHVHTLDGRRLAFVAPVLVLDALSYESIAHNGEQFWLEGRRDLSTIVGDAHVSDVEAASWLMQLWTTPIGAPPLHVFDRLTEILAAALAVDSDTGRFVTYVAELLAANESLNVTDAIETATRAMA